MLTLTVRSGNYAGPDEAAADLKRGLVALRKRIFRAYGEKMSFLAVFEKHKSGFPHLHLLIRSKFIPVQWLKAAWEEITGSFMVDIRKIKTKGQAAYYVAKYVGKDLSAFAHCKRWWRSHDFNEGGEDYVPAWAPTPCWSVWEADIGLLESAFRALAVEPEREKPERLTWRTTAAQGAPVGEAMQIIKAYWPAAQPVRRY